MAIYLTGDIHGMTDDPDRFEAWSFPEGEELTEDDYVIILGDFGMPFAGYPDDELRKLAAKPWTTLFIDGNHECYPFLRELDGEDWHGGRVQRYSDHPSIIHLMRGEVYDIRHDDLTAFLDELEDRLDYRYWFFGHFHEDAQIDERHSILFQDIVDLDDFDF